jgi:hypothetical protein
MIFNECYTIYKYDCKIQHWFTTCLIANLTKDEIKIEKKNILGIFFLENNQINKFLFNNVSSFYFPK